MTIRIEDFSIEYSQHVVDLVIGIQRDEFGLKTSPAEQPDLVDINGHYRDANGNFWLALDEDSVVGTIGLLDLGNGLGSLRKMFVRPKYRGTGTAERLLDQLLAWTKSKGFTQLFLGTTSAYHAAQRFYEKHGFHALPRTMLPKNFPVFEIEDRFYHRDLGRE